MLLRYQTVGQDTERVLRVLFVSALESELEFMRAFFARTNWSLSLAQSLQEAAILLASEQISVIITDRELAGGSWQDLMHLARGCILPPVLIVTHRFSEIEMLDQLLKQGAYDVLAKPFQEIELSQIISFAWLRWNSKHLMPLQA